MVSPWKASASTVRSITTLQLLKNGSQNVSNGHLLWHFSYLVVSDLIWLLIVISISQYQMRWETRLLLLIFNIEILEIFPMIKRKMTNLQSTLLGKIKFLITWKIQTIFFHLFYYRFPVICIIHYVPISKQLMIHENIQKLIIVVKIMISDGLM